MARQPHIRKHPRVEEIDQALRNAVPFRAISKEFGVSLASLSRRANAIGVGRQRPSLPGRSGTPPDTSTPFPEAGSSEGNGWSYTPRPDDALFDVLSLSYPWREGEPRNPDPRAEQLRGVQRKYGVEAVKAEVLALMGDFRRMNLSPHSFARQLDVPPHIVQQWLAARQDHDTAQLLHTDASARVSRDYADLTDAIASIDKKLADPNLGTRVFAQLTQQKTKLMDQRGKLVEKHGLDQFTVDNRDRGAKLIHEAMSDCFDVLAQMIKRDREAGIDPLTGEPVRKVRERTRPKAA